MQRKYENFEERDTADGVYLVGEPTHPDGAHIHIEAGWFESEPGEKRDWEYIVEEIVASGLQENLQFEVGEVTVARDRAVESIAGADLDADTSVANRDQAEAIVDYLIETGVLTQRRNDEIVVLQDPAKLTSEDSEFDAQEREYYILSWAAAIDTSLDHMQDALDRFRDARERLQEEIEEGGQEEASHVERELEQLKQNIRRLRAAKDTYESKVGEMRKAALRQQAFPNEDAELAKNIAGLITSLSNAENSENREESAAFPEDVHSDNAENSEKRVETTAFPEEVHRDIKKAIDLAKEMTELLTELLTQLERPENLEKQAESWSATEDLEKAVDEALEDVGEVVDEVETSVDETEEELDESQVG